MGKDPESKAATVIRDELTAIVLTFNEAPNVQRTLEKLQWVPRVLVVDSFSTDETPAIAASFPNVRIVQRAFDTFVGQCNFALGQVTSEWVLSLDADYVLSDDFRDEVTVLEPAANTVGYRASFKYAVFGRPLRASLYPPRTVLYRRDRARYRDEGHGHRVQIDGNELPLRSVIFHDDRKPMERWVAEQNRYMIAEAAALLATPLSNLKLQDRLRRSIVFAPVAVLFYTLFGKGLILDGWRGWFYVLQRVFAEMLLSLRLLEGRLGSDEGAGK